MRPPDWPAPSEQARAFRPASSYCPLRTPDYGKQDYIGGMRIPMFVKLGSRGPATTRLPSPPGSARFRPGHPLARRWCSELPVSPISGHWVPRSPPGLPRRRPPRLRHSSVNVLRTLIFRSAGWAVLRCHWSPKSVLLPDAHDLTALPYRQRFVGHRTNGGTSLTSNPHAATYEHARYSHAAHSTPPSAMQSCCAAHPCG